VKPRLHAKSSAKKFGGVPEDYQDIHDWFDASKAHHADVRHRAILHSTFGIYLCEQVYGAFIINSEGKEVSVRDIGEQHVLEDLGRIPSIGDYLENMVLQPWMGGPGKSKQEEIKDALKPEPDFQELLKKLQEQPPRLKNPNRPFGPLIMD
jgi:hypothetical protein